MAHSLMPRTQVSTTQSSIRAAQGRFAGVRRRAAGYPARPRDRRQAAALCRWIFTLLGAAPGDTLDDLFGGLRVVPDRESDGAIRRVSEFNQQVDIRQVVRDECHVPIGQLIDILFGQRRVILADRVPASIQQNILLDRKMPFKSPGLGKLTRLDSVEYDSETFWIPCSARRFPYSEFSAPAKNIFTRHQSRAALPRRSASSRC